MWIFDDRLIFGLFLVWDYVSVVIIDARESILIEFGGGKYWVKENSYMG